MRTVALHRSVVLQFLCIGLLLDSRLCFGEATLIQEIDPPAIHLGDTAKISITVKDGGWTRLLQLPKVDALTIIRLGQEEIEGTAEHPIVISRFSAVPTHTGDFTIPGFDVKTQTNETLHVQPITLHVLDPGQNIPPQLLAQPGNPSANTNSAPNVAEAPPPPDPENNGQASPSTPAPPSALPANDASKTTELYNDNNALDEIQIAAKDGNASAQYQLAMRLLSGNARSQAATQVVTDSINDLQQFLSNQNVVAHSIFNPNPSKLQQYVTLEGEPAIQQYISSRLSGSANLPDSDVQNNAEVRKYVSLQSDPLVQQYVVKKDAFLKLVSAIVKKEIDQALQLLQLSANQGYLDAITTLSVWYDLGNNITYTSQGVIVYNSGDIVAKDEAKSFALAQKAADLQSPTGMRLLGIHYAAGKGVTKDVAAGVKWLEVAGNKGDLAAFSYLSKILCDGGADGHDDGFPKDPQRAYILGRVLQIVGQPDSLAQKWGDEDVAKVRVKLSPDDLISAESKAEDKAAELKAASTTLDAHSSLGVNTYTKDQASSQAAQPPANPVSTSAVSNAQSGQFGDIDGYSKYADDPRFQLCFEEFSMRWLVFGADAYAFTYNNITGAKGYVEAEGLNVTFDTRSGDQLTNIDRANGRTNNGSLVIKCKRIRKATSSSWGDWEEQDYSGPLFQLGFSVQSPLVPQGTLPAWVK
jgi:TPR repeat protein